MKRIAALAPLLLALAPAPAPVELTGIAEQGALLRGTAPPGTRSITLDGHPIPVAPDGRFLVGFDRDAPPLAHLVVERADGSRSEQVLAVSARAWRMERIATLRRPAVPTAEFLRRREGELARIALARSAATDAQGWRQPFTWPARGRISGRFGSQRFYAGEPGAFHAGVDVAAGAGALVTAPAAGVVTLAGSPAFSLEGNLVIVDHGQGLNSAFLHLATTAVAVGQKVSQGDPIGTIGRTGRATGPHLHWAVRWGEARLDPARLAGPMAR
jgi:murein DD-endopeptidase MepM/ murein hydrolase activator NlpD